MYKIVGDCIKNLETGGFIPKSTSNRHYHEYLKWLAEGNEPEPEFSDEELAEQAKQAAIDFVASTYQEKINGPIECSVGEKIYYMDGLEKSAVKMKHGIELAELMGATSMDIVDYYNKVHEGVSLPECQEIMLQQAISYYNAWQTKVKDRAEIIYPE